MILRTKRLSTLKLRYSAVKEKIAFEEGAGYRVAYGIAVWENQNGKWVDAGCISDISPNKEEVELLAQQCTVYQLELCHFEDVVLDYLNSK